MTKRPGARAEMHRRAALGGICAGLLAVTSGCTGANALDRGQPADITGPQADWSSKRGGPARRNRTDATLTTPDAPIELGSGQLTRAPVFGPEAAFFCSADWRTRDETDTGGVVAVTQESATVRWIHEFDEARGHPTVVGDTVFVQGRRLLALDRTTGDRRWQLDVPYGWWRTGPLPTGDRLVVTDGARGAIRAVRMRDGQSEWTRRLEADPRGMAAPEDKAAEELYVVVQPTGDTSRLQRRDPTSGELVWETDTGGKPAGSGTPVVGESHVFVRERDRIATYRRQDGTLAWSRRARPILSTGVGLAFTPGRLYCLRRNGSTSGRLIAVEPADGTVSWTGPTVPATDAAALTVLGDGVVTPLASGGPRVGLVDPDTGRVRRTVSLPAHPVTGLSVGPHAATAVTVGSDGDDSLLAFRS